MSNLNCGASALSLPLAISMATKRRKSLSRSEIANTRLPSAENSAPKYCTGSLAGTAVRRRSLPDSMSISHRCDSLAEMDSRVSNVLSSGENWNEEKLRALKVAMMRAVSGFNGSTMMIFVSAARSWSSSILSRSRLSIVLLANTIRSPLRFHAGAPARSCALDMGANALLARCIRNN